MTALFVYASHSARHALIKGNIRDWLRDNRIPAMYTAMHRGWLVRQDRVADLVARAEHDGILVHVKGRAA